MKKLAYLTIFFISSHLVFAQQDSSSVLANKPDFGLKTGLNLSILSASFNNESSFKPGFHLGAFMKTRLGNSGYFQPEIYYSNQGQKNDYGADGSTKLNMNYLNIPLLFGFGKRFSVQAGPQFGFLFAAKEVGELNGSSMDDDLMDYTNTVDFSLVLGLEFKANENIALGARMNYGMTNVFADIEDYEIENRVFHFYLSYAF
jgi:hypothetical protein